MLEELLNQPKVLIIDDFYPDLDWVLPHVRNHEFKRPENVNYNSRVSPVASVSGYAVNKLHQILGREFDYDSYDGEVRATLACDVGSERTFVHTDDQSVVSVLIYLSDCPPHIPSEQLGTSFYIHRQMKIDRLHAITPLKLQIQRGILVRDTKDLNCWECYQTVPMKKNRAVIFDSRLFHSPPTISFGEDIESSRLTQHFFPKAKK